MEEFTLTPTPAAWPLMFVYRAPILGHAFVAVVELEGRLLARPEGERVWLDGVNPGAFALGAPSLATANLELHSALTAVFVDFAERSESFEAFRSAVETFFHETDVDTVAEWDASVAAVRRGQIAAPAGLPVRSAETPPAVRVIYKSLESVTPGDNTEPEPVLAAAA